MPGVAATQDAADRGERWMNGVARQLESSRALRGATPMFRPPWCGGTAEKTTPGCGTSAMDTDQVASDNGGIELLHAIPGRIRLRVPEIKGNPARAREVEQQLSGLKRLRRVEVNPVTGSVLMVHDPDDSDLIAELGRLFETGRELAAVLASPDPMEEIEDAVTVSLVEGIMSNLRAVNANLRATTGGLDLRILLPVAMILLGFKALVTERERRPAWYNYFWFAFGLFCTLNRQVTSVNVAVSDAAGEPATVHANGAAD
jgi:hypothetical protein